MLESFFTHQADNLAINEYMGRFEAAQAVAAYLVDKVVEKSNQEKQGSQETVTISQVRN